MTYPCPDRASAPGSPLVHGQTFLREVYPNARPQHTCGSPDSLLHLSRDLAGCRKQRGVTEQKTPSWSPQSFLTQPPLSLHLQGQPPKRQKHAPGCSQTPPAVCYLHPDWPGSVLTTSHPEKFSWGRFFSPPEKVSPGALHLGNLEIQHIPSPLHPMAYKTTSQDPLCTKLYT